MRRTVAVMLFVLTVCVFSTGITSPERSKGISMHMLPKRVADLSGAKWGFTVTYASYLKIESEPPTLQTTKEFLSFVRKQDQAVQDNGVWIVITDRTPIRKPRKYYWKTSRFSAKRNSFRFLFVEELIYRMDGSATTSHNTRAVDSISIGITLGTNDQQLT